jgi:hypothetical protein
MKLQTEPEGAFVYGSAGRVVTLPVLHDREFELVHVVPGALAWTVVTWTV